MIKRSDELGQALDLAGLEIDDLEISDFLDDALVQQSDAVANVMAASCTTCECCCSCILLVKTESFATKTIAQVEAHFKPEQLRFIKSRDPKYRDPARYAQEEWPEIINQVAEEMAKGSDPSSGSVQALAQRWTELLHLFTGANPEIETTLQEMYKKTPHPAARLGAVPDQKMIKFMTKAVEASRAGGG